jgi:hypothetical protein
MAVISENSWDFALGPYKDYILFPLLTRFHVPSL